jgi:hypothetical protein
MGARGRSRSRQLVPGELSDDEKDAQIAASMGNPLNMSIYDPHETERVSEVGGWAMIRRPLPAIERDLDKYVTIGCVFWVTQMEGTEDGFDKYGRYKVRCASPFGEVCLWPYEYVILDAQFLMHACQEGALHFHPAAISAEQFTEQMFYCMKCGIGREEAMMMSLGTLTGPVGWFEPHAEVAEFVNLFANVGGGMSIENKQRRSDARQINPPTGKKERK